MKQNMESLKPIIIKWSGYSSPNFGIAFGSLEDKDKTKINGYKYFQSKGIELRRNEEAQNNDELIQLTPSLYFQLSQCFSHNKRIYNLKKFRYEVNKYGST